MAEQRTLKDVLKTLAKIVTEHPDRSNEGQCVYVRGDLTPHCVIANVIAEDGLWPEFGGETIERMRGATHVDATPNGLGIGALGDRWGVSYSNVIVREYDDEAISFMRAVQDIADGDGAFWKDAFLQALEDRGMSVQAMDVLRQQQVIA